MNANLKISCLYYKYQFGEYCGIFLVNICKSLGTYFKISFKLYIKNILSISSEQNNTMQKNDEQYIPNLKVLSR